MNGALWGLFVFPVAMVALALPANAQSDGRSRPGAGTDSPPGWSENPLHLAMAMTFLDGEPDWNALSARTGGRTPAVPYRLHWVILMTGRMHRDVSAGEMAMAERYMADLLAGSPGDPLRLLYSGLVQGMLARKKTLFGLDNLRAFEDYLYRIDRTSSPWFVVLLRGRSLAETASSLPDLPFFAERRARAGATARDDFAFVDAAMKRGTVPRFDPADYPWDTMPVPESVAGWL